MVKPYEKRIAELELHVIPNPDGGERPLLHDAIIDVICKERDGRDKEIAAAVSQVKEWFENKLAANLGALEGRIAQQFGQYSSRADTLGIALEKERTDRRTEIDSAIKEMRSALEEKTASRLTAFEQRMAQGTSRTDALSTAIEKERADRHAEIEAGLAEVRRALEEKTAAKLTALEEHVKALLPVRLPIAKDFRPDTVHYAGEVVVHRGSAYQALRDTAKPPPHADDWVILAAAGRDAITPTVRDTYDVREKYHQLDIVAMDGGSFIAKRDNPGVCPGDGWRLLAKQGRVGRPGAPGERGPRGERGETGPATMPAIVSSKIENFNLVVLREDKSLEIFDLRPAFELYDFEVSNRYDG